MGYKSQEQRNEYSKEYMKKNLKRIPLDVKPFVYDHIKYCATQNNETVNGYIKRVLDEEMKGINRTTVEEMDASHQLTLGQYLYSALDAYRLVHFPDEPFQDFVLRWMREKIDADREYDKRHKDRR